MIHKFSIKSRGFTLIELMVAMGILAIVASVGYATFANAQVVGRDGKRRQDLESLRQALLVYKQSPSNNHLYPGSLGALSPVYINSVPQDPNGGGYNYQPNISNTSYYICATLEAPNPADPHADCSGTENYEVTSPN